MSGEIGEIIRDGESSKPSNVDGAIHVENGDSGAAGNVSQPANIIDGYESWNPSGPATERIPRTEPAEGEPKRTKSGKIDRRTRAGRGSSQQTSDSVAAVPRGGKLISLEKAILSLHDMAAGIFGIEEICITEQEASALNDAVLDVSKYYVSAFDPKKVAVFNLVTCMGGIYATRIMAYRNRMALERRSKLSVMPNKQGAPQAPMMTVEQYLGGMPPNEGAAGF